MPDDNPAMPALLKTFGEHTFYLFENGLMVLLPVNDDGLSGEPAEFVRVADWASEKKDSLKAVEPHPTGYRLDISGEAPAGPGDAA